MSALGDAAISFARIQTLFNAREFDEAIVCVVEARCFKSRYLHESTQQRIFRFQQDGGRNGTIEFKGASLIA
ncbi:hypothetical protein HK100_003676, partial [Physocladia obscura]